MRETVSLYPCHHSPKAQIQPNAKGDLLILWLHSQGDLRVCEGASGFPAVWNAAKKAHFFFHPIQNTGVCCTTQEQRGAGRTADGVLRGHQKDMDLTDHFVESIRKPAHKLLGDVSLEDPPPRWPMGT